MSTDTLPRTAPRITAAMLRKADETLGGVVVRYAATDVVAALPKLGDLADDPDVEVLLAPLHIRYWLGKAGGDCAIAAKLATRALAAEHALEVAAEARLAAAALERAA